MIIDMNNYKNKNGNIRFTHKSILEGDKNTKLYRIILMLENKKTGIKVPHPLTEFFSSFNSLQHSSVVNKANYIVPFLNYVFFDNCNIYKLKTLSDLNLEHGIDYLNDFSEGKIGRRPPSWRRLKEQNEY